MTQLSSFFSIRVNQRFIAWEEVNRLNDPRQTRQNRRCSVGKALWSTPISIEQCRIKGKRSPIFLPIGNEPQSFTFGDAYGRTGRTDFNLSLQVSDPSFEFFDMFFLPLTTFLLVLADAGEVFLLVNSLARCKDV